MLAWILAAGAGICLAYFIIVVMYSGIGTSFAILWLLLGGFLGATAVSVYGYQKAPHKIALWIPVSLVTLCVSGMLVVLVVQILIFGRVPFTAEPNLDYVIVLGAGVKPEGLSKTLKLRLDKATEYALENPNTILILSGGQGADEPATEAVAMEAYLMSRGIPKEQMLLEENSYNTVQNMAYSKALIDQREIEKKQWKNTTTDHDFSALELVEKPIRIGVLTNNFHLYRASMIGAKQGLSDLEGIAAESDRILFAHFCLRDSLAILKDRLMGNL